MRRRQMIQAIGAALLGWPLASFASGAECLRRKLRFLRHRTWFDHSMTRRKLLFFSRSALFEHPVIRREGNELSFAERQLIDLAKPLGCDVECTKDGGVFERDLDAYAAVIAYTCGKPADLMKPESLDNSPPMTERGWQNLNRAVREGKPLVGIHPGLWLLPEAFGADTLNHGAQQVAKMIVASPNFPGVQGLGESFSMMEEWFSLVRFVEDVHVILAQDCMGMDTKSEADRRCYDRPPFPATWARMHGNGRVFYTSMGHREDVWTNPIFRQVLLGGLSWALGDLNADISPNLKRTTPRADACDAIV